MKLSNYFSSTFISNLRILSVSTRKKSKRWTVLERTALFCGRCFSRLGE